MRPRDCLNRSVLRESSGLDELNLGLELEPEKGIPRIEEFVPVWQELAEGYATMKPGVFDDLRAAGLPMRELGRDTRRVIVSRQ